MSGRPSWDPDRVRRRVVFWRHGRTDWNSQGRFQGQEDIPLDDTGRDQARRSALLLQQLAPSRIVSSDLLRAQETATALASLCGLELTTDARLRETYAGRWQGKTFAEIGEQFPEEQAKWHAGSVTARAGGGERRVDVGQRMAAAVLEAVEEMAPDETLLIVSHGGAIRVALAAVLGLPQEYWGVISGVTNCHWSVLEELDERAEVSTSVIPGRGALLTRWHLTEHNVGLAGLPASPVEG
ncbi:histidine phosphatase family protein [Arthrobacter roseus]|uniref:histidine phosphatase family protein n=1 Tax=Arthrobacter roseus TaxID=136274 RepID=UPI0019660211|nr:histidine phosphatase family protein [Arthrobacter roseus]MBM7848763.1 putative phosphoglycerate mutase [Arthrobacter roseus]